MKLKLIAAMLTLAFLNFSCTKDEEETPEPAKPYQLPGLYIGTYTVNQLPNQTPLRYVLSIEPDGTITTEGRGADGNTYYSQGTWNLNGKALTATYSTINYTNGAIVKQAAAFTFNADSATLTEGTWTDVINPYGHLDGKFQTFNRVKDNP